MANAQRVCVGVAVALALICIPLAGTAWSVMPEDEAAFKTHLSGQKVVQWAFAPSDLQVAAAIVDYGTYGEYCIYGRKGGEITAMVTGKLRPEQIQGSRCHFIMGGAHLLVVLREDFANASLSSLLIHDLTSDDPSRRIFSIPRVYDLRYELLSLTELILWQKDRAFYNQGVPPYKYNYFLVSYDKTQNRYTFDFHLRNIVAAQDEDGVMLNNRAIQLYRQGNLKSAKTKLEDALMVGQVERGIIAQNRRLLAREQGMLENRQTGEGADGVGAAFDSVKLSYLLGEYDLALMTLESGRQRWSRGNRIALYGLCYARKRDYAELQRMSKVLIDGDYEYLTEYFEEVARILFYNRDLGVLQAYMKSLESRDSLNPTLAYLKAALLADAGRLEFAELVLDNYLSRVSDEDYYLGECEEYLCEIASILGHLDVESRTRNRLVQQVIWDLGDMANLANFSGFLHTDEVKLKRNTGPRIIVPEDPLEKFGIG